MKTRNETLLIALTTYFNKSEVETLCFELDIKHEEFPHKTLTNVAIGLIRECDNRGIDLTDIIYDKRPNVSLWSIQNE